VTSCPLAAMPVRATCTALAEKVRVRGQATTSTGKERTVPRRRTEVPRLAMALRPSCREGPAACHDKCVSHRSTRRLASRQDVDVTSTVITA